MAQSVKGREQRVPSQTAKNAALHEDRSFWWNFTDTFVMAQRNLMYYRRQPQLLVFATIQPTMILLLFTFVFGGAIGGSTEATGGNYINFLLPGILIQTIVFAATNTTTGLSDDLSKGMIDRFRTLPMARSAVLAGRTLADTLRGLFTISIMMGVGFLIGFRFENGVFYGLLGMLLAVAFGHAFTWISAFIGLFVSDPETAQVAGFIWVFPITFASSVFVPPETMPTWLRAFAENQPITMVANSVRGLMVTGDLSDLVWALLWIVGIFLVFMPLSVRQYAKAATR